MKTHSQLDVLVIGRFYAEGVAVHIAETFEAMGHRVVRFEAGFQQKTTARTWVKRLHQVRHRIDELASHVSFVRERFRRRLLAAATRAPIDLSVVCHDFLQPHEVRLLKQATRAPVVIWFPDALSNFVKTMFLNADYDAIFLKDPYVVHTLRRTLHKPLHYLPEACHPSRYPQAEPTLEQRRRFECDVCTAGNLYAYRAEFFAQLADFDVKLWGNPPPLWMDDTAIRGLVQGRYVVYEEKALAFRCARIVVNNLHPAEIWGINARAFEIAGLGGFQLIDWRPGLSQLFEDGRELVSFRTLEELRKQIVHYLAQPEERADIARRGFERACRDHTFEARLTCLLETLGGGKGYPMPEIRME